MKPNEVMGVMRVVAARNAAREIVRMWINQPSDLQPLHYLHGTNVLVQREANSDMYRAYFLTGDTISMHIGPTSLSAGWRTHAVQSDEVELTCNDGNAASVATRIAGNAALRAALQRYVDCDSARDLLGDTPARQARDALRGE